MNKLTLKFLSAGESAQLEETHFSSPLIGRTVSCRRGVQTVVKTHHGTFAWSAGVMGLSAIFIRAKASSCSSSSQAELAKASGISSAESDWARAFDSSLSKRPQWALDMFGLDASGTPLLRRLFVRQNPEKKRPGPVAVYLNTSFLQPTAVSISLDGQELTDVASLKGLLRQIGFPGVSPAAKASPRPKEEAAPPPFFFPNDVAREISVMLWGTDIFSRAAYVASYRKLCGIVDSLGGPRARQQALPEIDSKVTEAGFLGLREFGENSAALRRAGPLRVATGAAAFSSIALLRHVAKRYGCCVEIDCEHVNTRTLIREIGAWQGAGTPPDAVVVSVSCAAMLNRSARRPDYVPLMVLPGNSHRVVKSRELVAPKRKTREWTFISDEPTTSSFYLDDMFSEASRAAYGKRYADQHELLNVAALERGDFQAVLWYPHYRFQEVFNGHASEALASQAWHYTGNVLCLRADRFAALALPLNIAVRDSWLDLRLKPSIIQELAAELMNSDEYVQALYRTSGLLFYPDVQVSSLRSVLAPAHSYSL